MTMKILRLPWALVLAMVLAACIITSYSLIVEHRIIRPAQEAASKSSWSVEEALETQAGPPVFYNDFDGYYYTSYAREMVEKKCLRIRWTGLDNPPDGRPVQWSSLFSWVLLSLGAVYSLFSGLGISEGILTAGYIANPLLFGVFLFALGWAVWRRVGALAAFVLVATLASYPETLEDFSYARPDHHGLHVIFAMGTLLCLILGGGGWVRQEAAGEKRYILTHEAARRWFIASGILGGCGLWVGATQQSLVIGCTGIGGMAASFFLGARKKTSPGSREFRPELWRSWSRAGAAMSLFAYGIEYLPSLPVLHLEVNHPLHALTWICGGEVLYRLGKWRQDRAGLSAKGLLLFVLLASGTCILPLAVLLGPLDWFLVKDTHMLRLHEDIEEFLPFLHRFPALSATYVFKLLGLPVLATAAGLAALCSRKSRPMEQSLILIALVPALVFGACFLMQFRWIGYFCVAASCVLTALFVYAGPPTVKRGAGMIASAALFLAVIGLGLFLNLSWTVRELDKLGTVDGKVAMALDLEIRELAFNLHHDAGSNDIKVMCGPVAGSRIHFFGPCQGTSSFYWENVDGVRAAAEFYSDYGEDTARRILKERRIDYVVSQASPYFVSFMHYVNRGNKKPSLMKGTLAHRLMSGKQEVPSWLEPIPIKGSFAARDWLIFRVVKDNL